MSAFDRLFGGGAGRVPELTADSDVECGAACLTMILHRFGREVAIAEVHERCRVGRDGASALDIANAARTYGLRVHPVSVDLDDLRDVPTPAVLHWGFAHFVVLESWDGREATIVDPAIGRRHINRGELSDEFTGVALAMAPGTAFDDHEPESPSESATRIVLRRAAKAPGAKRLMVQVLAASLVLQILGLSVPLLTKSVVNSVLPLEVHEVMAVLGAGIVVIIATQLALTFMRGLVLVNLQAKLDAELMAGFFEHLLSLPYQWFQERSTGDLLQRLGSNAQIRDILSSQTLTAALDGSFVIVYGFVLLIASPIFGLVAIALGVLQAVLLVTTARRMTALVTKELSAQGESQAFLVESISGIEALKAAGAEARTLSHWTGIFSDQLEATMRRGRLSVVLVAATSTLQRFAPLILLWIGAMLVLGGGMSLGAMLALVSLAQLFLTPVTSLVAAGMQLQQVGGHLERIASVLRAEPEQSNADVRTAGRLGGDVQFDDVWFRYDDSAPWAVKGFNLHIRPGERIALVGRTGSGKSTIARLILGLYEPERGVVRMDGTPLVDLDARSVRSQCGVVMQDPTVFNGSIRRNIAYNDPSTPLPAVMRAAQLASLHEEIERMPMGYETIVAESGSALSGGQRQRLAIARALVHDPPLLVLDEATSALDSATESAVTEHLAAQRVTALVIAHRLSTVQDADLILVMDNGEVVARGTHTELLAEGGLYTELVADQLTAGAPSPQPS